MTDDAQQRRHYRVRYPIAERPKLAIDESQYEILELSEGGLRLSVYLGIESSPLPETIHAEITLACGRTRSITASFTRQEGEEHICTGLEGISLSDITEEQRYLIRKYPSFGRE
jgi:hypothetical protein